MDMDLFAAVSATVLSGLDQATDIFSRFKCLSDLKKLQQTNIPVYSFTEHQRLDETKYLYGATIIIGIVWLLQNEPLLQSLLSGGYLDSSRPRTAEII